MISINFSGNISPGFAPADNILPYAVVIATAVDLMKHQSGEDGLAAGIDARNILLEGRFGC